MTVTMTVEEFDSFRADQKLRLALFTFLHEKVHYTSEAFDCHYRNSWKYAKALSRDDVSELLRLLEIGPNYDNVDQPEEDE